MITRNQLKELIARESWDEIKSFFPDFKPDFIWMKGGGWPDGKRCFNWRSLTPAMNRLWARKIVPGPKPETQAAVRLTENSKGWILHRLQSGECHYCGQATIMANWSADHLTPRSRGGRNTAANYVGCCHSCNRAKANMTFDEFLRTDYLSAERRAILGYFSAPTTKFSVAKKQHNQRGHPPLSAQMKKIDNGLANLTAQVVALVAKEKT